MICSLMPVWLEDTTFIILFDFRLWRVILQSRLLSESYAYTSKIFASYMKYSENKTKGNWMKSSLTPSHWILCLPYVYIPGNRQWKLWVVMHLSSFSLRVWLPYNIYDNLISNIHLEFISHPEISLLYYVLIYLWGTYILLLLLF